VSWFPESVPVPGASKTAYRKRLPILRQELLGAQAKLLETPTPLVLLLAGVDGAGKGEIVTRLNEWLDPRWLRTHAFDDPSDEERERPPFWRYWRALPPQGHTAIFLSAWYSEPLVQRAYGDEEPWFATAVDRIRRFERTLADGGVLVVKLWLHLGREEQEKRLRELERDPLLSWRVSEKDWEHWRLYDRFVATAEALVDGTHTQQCPWRVIDGSDPRRREVGVGEALLEAIGPRLREVAGQEPSADAERQGRRSAARVVERAPGMPRSEYRAKLRRAQGKLNHLHRLARERGIPVVAVFEGRDASGKGGAIRRVMAAHDPRSVHVVRVGPPSEEERRYHYLWRFWRHLPRAGRVTLFDRSWYGRVLVERVEGFATPEEWRRAFGEINDFEQDLVGHGIVLVKLWLHIDRKEQARRFEARRRVAYKRWKLTDEDQRNRERWDDYDEALADVLALTHTPHAPWTEVQASDKRRARLASITALSQALERRLTELEGAQTPTNAGATPLSVVPG
jgi:polyphosphate:AMP phosphotransferase